ncbi:putative RDD family membrane protein YckC [Streptomyces olivoverticillatus]|uniref:Putative RDD family membrane protein YckC n=1 Tax=Streptomyces olivoverticillatus TaxID=66427 RepID=A0A7W7PJI9_9ACTN|nr:RDD family protein [Streptomyces olivoverticillatus]MBB4892172.1 putative RDD family membrane protein YckC [Streptomyces olivoverticillatus]
MSTDQPTPENDPFKKGPEPPPYPGSGAGAGGPYGGPGGQGGPYGGAPGGGPYGGAPGGGPYGGAPDPLAGMPPLANRGKRLLARIIDGLLVGVPISVIFYGATWGSNPWNDQAKSTSLSIIIAVVYFVYEGLMLTSRGQTVGKMAMHIRVAMLENGAIPAGRPGWTRAAVYNLPEIVPCCGFIFWLVNVLWCTWDDPYHQCLHDKAAKTVVVSTVQ